MTRFWLIRHGEPGEEAIGRCYGSLDLKLSAKGRAQMARVADHLAAEHTAKQPIAAIYTSPLDRAIESSRILAAKLSCPVHIVPDLREINFGEFEGLPYDEIAICFPDTWRQWMEAPTEVRFPNGECFSEMRARVLAAFETIRRGSQGRTVAIVSHGGVNRTLVAWALQMPNDYSFCLCYRTTVR